MIPTSLRPRGASAVPASLLLPLLPLLLLLASGCANDDIRAYRAPKDDTSTQTASSPHGGGAPMPTADVVPAGPVWTLPAGWQEEPGSGMRFATIRMGPGESAPEIRVTPLAAMAGDPLPNVNRWLEQLGKPHIEMSQLGEVMRTVPVGDNAADLIRLTGPGDDPQQVLAAILPVGDRVWFFMSMDRQSVLEPLADDFDRFVQGVRMLPPAHPPIGGAMPAMPERTASSDMPDMPASGGEPTPGSSETVDGLSWVLPAGWEEQPSSSSMRLATFVAGHAEVTITRFPGDVGGELANINRWRGQLGLQPVANLADQEQTDRTVAGSDAMYLDLQGSQQRMLVAAVPRGGQTWFLKMTGPNDLLGREKEHFEVFLDSVRLPGAPQ